MGVPVVTLAGTMHHSRVGLSLLHAAGLSQWIAATPDEYVEKAVTLARDRASRNSLRNDLRPRLLASSLMDAVAYTRRLEAAYRQAWRQWAAANPRTT